MKSFLLTLIAVFFLNPVFSQARIRKLPQGINHPSMNVYAPYMSLDGKTLLYLSDYSENNELVVYYTVRDGADWSKPSAAPGYLNNRLNYLLGYTLDAEAKTVYLSSAKSGGVGGYDIWMADWKRGSWSEIRNPGAPINSQLNDASPSLTPDGKTMYFMRCEKMDQRSADGCKIYVIRKTPTGQWGAAEALPDNINTGNCQLPRIMASGEMLIFSSNTMPQKSGSDFDLYMTKFQNGKWSDPKPLDFVNTDKSDLFVSVVANGRYLLRDSPGASKYELVEYLFPDDIKPKGAMKIEGKSTPPNAYLSVIDGKGNRVFNGRPEADGSFSIYLVEGEHYLFSADPERGEFTYFTKVYDLTANPPLTTDRLEFSLHPVATSEQIELNALRFKPHTSEIEPGTGIELEKVGRLLKSVPNLKVDINITLTGYLEDSLQSDPDLTEIRYDTTYVINERTDTIVVVSDSTNITQASSEPDSSAVAFTRDSTIVQTTIDTIEIVRIIYHNNRTNAQAQVIADELKRQGISPERITLSTAIKPEALNERKTRILITAQKNQ